jgi:GH24 family phage-related lysozyme (muramidase)
MVGVTSIKTSTLIQRINDNDWESTTGDVGANHQGLENEVAK